MDIFNYAKKNEKAMEDLYKQLADQTNHEGVKRIFHLIADEERKHYNIIVDLEKNLDVTLHQSDVLENSKLILHETRGEDENLSELKKLKEIEIYKEIQQLEKESEDFYREKAEQTDNPDHKRVFNILANEEKKHYYFIDQFVELVDRPNTWLEDAEFHHLDKY